MHRPGTGSLPLWQAELCSAGLSLDTTQPSDAYNKSSRFDGCMMNKDAYLHDDNKNHSSRKNRSKRIPAAADRIHTSLLNLPNERFYYLRIISIPF